MQSWLDHLHAQRNLASALPTATNDKPTKGNWRIMFWHQQQCFCMWTRRLKKHWILMDCLIVNPDDVPYANNRMALHWLAKIFTLT